MVCQSRADVADNAGRVRGESGMKHRCRNCHFLQKVSAAYEIPQSWDQEDRDECWPRHNRNNDTAKAGDYELYKIYEVRCHKSIWSKEYDEYGNRAAKQSLKKKILRNRAEQCFFVEYHEGMPYPIAEELFRVRYDTRNLRRSLKWTIVGLFIAAFGSLISIVLQIYNTFWNSSTPSM